MTPPLIVVAGGEPAAADIARALVSRVGDAARVVVLAPRGPAVPGARHVLGRLARVDRPARVAVTEDGLRQPFDRLVVAVGARREPVVRGALTVGDLGDLARLGDLFRRALRAWDEGVHTRLAVVAHPDAGWALPAYGVALLLAQRAARWGARDALEIVLVTHETAPLGPGTGLDEALAAAGVRVRPGARVREWAFGWLHLEPAGRVAADRVVALPRVGGPAIGGLAADARGFVRAAPDGRVADAPGVWALGESAGPPGEPESRRPTVSEVAEEIVADLGLAEGRRRVLSA